MTTVTQTYAPLAAQLLGRHHDRPLLISVNGAQGTGKSTLSYFLKTIIESELNCRAVAVSIDDFYLTRAERQTLADKVHPLLLTRGVPGTHDLALMEHCFQNLLMGKSCCLPQFDKSCDDRHEQTLDVEPVEVIIFEGWCNHSPYSETPDLAEPINELERDEDADGVWRHYANEQLKAYHDKIFSMAHACVMLKAPDFEHVYHWRSLQEKKLGEQTSGSHVMNEAQLKRFIQHYERITRNTLQQLPDQANYLLPIGEDHGIQGIIVHDQ